jgi:TonB family protein
MKAVSKLLVLVSLGTLGAAAALATTAEQSYLETCRKDPGVPVPLIVVSPIVEPEYNGTTVQLAFVVDATGKPADFSVQSSPDSTVAMAVMDAVKQWRFKPAERDGAPVATKVVLPVKIVEPTPEETRYAAN